MRRALRTGVCTDCAGSIEIGQLVTIGDDMRHVLCPELLERL